MIRSLESPQITLTLMREIVIPLQNSNRMAQKALRVCCFFFLLFAFDAHAFKFPVGHSRKLK